MSDTIASLLGSAGQNPKIKKKGGKYVVEGMAGAYNTYQEAEQALVEPLRGQGPTMTSGQSAMDWGDEQAQPGSKAPNSSATPNQASDAPPPKPSYIVRSEKESGVTYEWDPLKKKWIPSKGSTDRSKPTPMPPGQQ